VSIPRRTRAAQIGRNFVSDIFAASEAIESQDTLPNLDKTKLKVAKPDNRLLPGCMNCRREISGIKLGDSLRSGQ